MNQSLKQVASRIAGMLGIGRITSMKDDGEVQKVQYQTPLEVASAPRMTDFGFSSGLPIGTDVVLAFLGGDRSSPVVIASNHQAYRRTGLKPGESLLYNQWGLEIHMTEDGIFVDAKGQDVEINNARKAVIHASESLTADTPILYCTGDIVDNCLTNTRTLKELREAHNDHDHMIESVQKGTSTVTSKATQRQVK